MPGLRPAKLDRQIAALSNATTRRNRSSGQPRNSTHSRSLFRSSYCRSGGGTSQTNGNDGHIRNRCRSRNCNRSSTRRHIRSSTRSRSLFRSSYCRSDGSSDAASQTSGNGGRSHSRCRSQNCSRSSIRRHNRSSGQRYSHSSTRNRKSARSRYTNYNRPNDGTPLHRRRSASRWRRPAQPPPTQFDVSWEELLNELQSGSARKSRHTLAGRD